jgi:chromosome segregation ATPase
MQHTEVEFTDVSIRLNELRSKLDRMMRNGETFQNVKDIYSQIKELECYQNALQWDPKDHSNSGRNGPSEESRSNSRISADNRYKHIPEPPPLL